MHGLADIELYLGGRASLKETIALWQQRVRNYAKRQLIWFRRIPAIQWVDIPAEEHPWESTQRILDLMRRERVQQLEVET